MSQDNIDGAKADIAAVNSAGIRLLTAVRDLALPFESGGTALLQKQVKAIEEAASSMLAAIKALEESKPSIYEKRGFTEL